MTSRFANGLWRRLSQGLAALILLCGAGGSLARADGVTPAEEEIRANLIKQAQKAHDGGDHAGAKALAQKALAIRATPDGAACALYGAAFTELLRLFANFEGSMVHVSCRGAGGAACEWRAAAPDPRHH